MCLKFYIFSQEHLYTLYNIHIDNGLIIERFFSIECRFVRKILINFLDFYIFFEQAIIKTQKQEL